MVVASRLRYLRDLVSHGALASVHFSCNGVTGDQKVKVLIDSSRRAVPFDGDMCYCIIAALVVVENASAQAIVTDRGHKHTSGKMEACFWIRHRARPEAVKELVPSDANLDEHVASADSATDYESAVGEDATPRPDGTHERQHALGLQAKGDKCGDSLSEASPSTQSLPSSSRQS